MRRPRNDPAPPQPAFRDELLRHGLLIATGVPGVYGRSGDFEDTSSASTA